MTKPDFVGGVYVEESPREFVVAKMRLSVERFDKFLQEPYVQQFLKKNNGYYAILLIGKAFKNSQQPKW